MKDVLYLQINRNIEVSKRDVTVGDVAGLYCQNSHVVNKAKTLKLLTVPDVKKKRICVSSMVVIKLIGEAFPELVVSNIGETDFIVDYIRQKPHNKVLQWFLIGFVALFTLVGSAYAVMAYNNDVGTTEVFALLYEKVNPGLSESNILEISYGVGLAAGIILFYNHFGGKRFGSDPTPIEVEMDKYEGDIDTTLIDRSSAANKEENV